MVTIALWAVFKWTRFGLATRAASENESAAMLGGLSPARIAVINTLVSSLLAGAVGILAASITQLDPETLPLQIIPALAAALLASFTSFWIATVVRLRHLDPLLDHRLRVRAVAGSRSPAASRCPA